MNEAKDFSPMDVVTYFRTHRGGVKAKAGLMPPGMAVGEVINRCGTKSLLVRFKTKDGGSVERVVAAHQVERGVREGAKEAI